MNNIRKNKVYSKIKTNLYEAFALLLQKQREKEINDGKIKTKKKSKQLARSCPVDPSIKTNLLHSSTSMFFQENFDIEQLTKFIQSIADLSVNELTIHFVGSTKVVLEEPYDELNKIILKITK